MSGSSSSPSNSNGMMTFLKVLGKASPEAQNLYNLASGSQQVSQPYQPTAINYPVRQMNAPINGLVNQFGRPTGLLEVTPQVPGNVSGAVNQFGRPRYDLRNK